MKTKLAILALAACGAWAPAGHAQGAGRLSSRPAHISAMRDWRFWAGEALIATAQILDGASTCRAFHRGAVEGGLIGNGRASCGTTAGVLGGAFLFDSSLNLIEHKYFVLKPNGLFDGVVAFSVPLAILPIHLTAAARNFSIPPKPDMAAALARIGPKGE